MATIEPGYVYILTNPSFKEDWVKIGKSSRPVNIRSKELDNTAVPLPFEIYATLKTEKYNIVERKIHKAIDRLTDLRIRQNREFFNIKPELALEILKDEAMVLDDAEITVYKDNQPVIADDHSSKCQHRESVSPCEMKEKDDGQADGTDTVVSLSHRPRFKFSMVNIPIGSEIVFSPTGLKVRVASDDQIEFDGRIYKLSPFVGTFMPVEKRNTSGAYQGAKYFTYNGETLDDIRTRIENESK